MNTEVCTACKGYGFLLANVNSTGKLEIQRCDSCNKSVNDNAATEAVFNLAQAALDLKDTLVLYYSEDDDNDFAADMRKVTAAYRLLRRI